VINITLGRATLVILLALAPMAVSAQAVSEYATRPTIGGITGLHLDRPVNDPNPHGVIFDWGGNFAWGMGLDGTLGYDYPSEPNGTVPDLVLAYSRMTRADNLRLRADDARMELGPKVGHPVLPFQFAITAGTNEDPLGGLCVRTFGHQYSIYMFNGGPSKRTNLNFYNLFGFVTDTDENGTGDFALHNYQSGANTLEIDPQDRMVIRAPALGFFGAAPVAKPVVTGSWSDGSAARDLLAKLVQLGLVTDGTTR
jgi:hypothetical protein